MSLVHTPNKNITILDTSVYIDNAYPGVTDEVTINLASETKDFKNARGAKYQSISMLPDITGLVKCRDITTRNLLTGVNGNVVDVEAGTQSEANVMLEAGKIAFLPHLRVSNVTVEKPGALEGDPAIPLVLGTHYRLNAAHGFIEPIFGGTGLAEATPVTVRYDHTAQTHGGILTVTAPERRVEFVTSRLHDDSPIRVCLYRAKFNPARSLNLAGQDYAALDLEFTALEDPTQASDAVLGKYGYIMGDI